MTRWTPDDMPDQSGRVVVVTGATSGLGLETALALAGKGVRVIGSTRDLDRAPVLNGKVEFHRLDLADLASVRAFAEGLLQRGDAIDVLVNNAGVMAIPERQTTADGFELQLGTNYLGHFALTGLLLPALLARPASRVVTLTGGVYGTARIQFDDLQAEKKYNPWRAYGQSKLANVLFMLELDRRARARSLDLISVAAHPGLAKTNLQYAGLRSARLTRFMYQPAARGALPTLRAATAPDVTGGTLYQPDGFLHLRGYPAPAVPAKRAQDEEVARRLWHRSEELTGVAFTAELDKSGTAGARR